MVMYYIGNTHTLVLHLLKKIFPIFQNINISNIQNLYHNLNFFKTLTSMHKNQSILNQQLD